MQAFEADLVLPVVEALKDKPYPLITIHDAILTTEEGLADVQASTSRCPTDLRTTCHRCST